MSKKSVIQFQAGMSLSAFLDRFGTEAQCREVLFQQRWPQGFQCPACSSRRHCRLDTRDLLQCNRCKHQVSLTAGTLFAQTKLPLRTWFLAIYLLTQHKNGLSAMALRRHLGVSYNTAWLLKHKLMQAMVEGEHDRLLHGVVQMDDAYWGGERHGGLRGRGSPGKTPFVAAVGCTPQGHPLHVRLDVVDGFRKTILADWARHALAPGCEVVSDGLSCFAAVGAAGCVHTVITTGGGVPDAPALRWVNTLLGNVKNAMHGTYHAIKGKYLQRYLSEFCYRFNRRFDLAGMIGQMICTATKTPPLPYRLATLDA
jgi:transposase-like protein